MSLGKRDPLRRPNLPAGVSCSLPQSPPIVGAPPHNRPDPRVCSRTLNKM